MGATTRELVKHPLGRPASAGSGGLPRNRTSSSFTKCSLSSRRTWRGRRRKMASGICALAGEGTRPRRETASHGAGLTRRQRSAATEESSNKCLDTSWPQCGARPGRYVRPNARTWQATTRRQGARTASPAPQDERSEKEGNDIPGVTKEAAAQSPVPCQTRFEGERPPDGHGCCSDRFYA